MKDNVYTTHQELMRGVNNVLLKYLSRIGDRINNCFGF